MVRAYRLQSEDRFYRNQRAKMQNYPKNIIGPVIRGILNIELH